MKGFCKNIFWLRDLHICNLAQACICCIKVFYLFSNFKILNQFQFDFRSKRSTVDVILELTKLVRKKSNCKQKFDCALFDLIQIFDIVNAEIFFYKLHLYEILKLMIEVIQ